MRNAWTMPCCSGELTYRPLGGLPNRRRRFLRARKFDIVKAKAMLVAAEEWRREFGVDELMQWVDTLLRTS